MPKHPPDVVNSNLNYETKSGTCNALHHYWMVGKLGFAQYYLTSYRRKMMFVFLLAIRGTFTDKKKREREIAFIKPLLLRGNDSIEILYILEILKTCKSQIGCGLNYKLYVRKKTCSRLNSNGLKNCQYIK